MKHKISLVAIASLLCFGFPLAAAAESIEDSIEHPCAELRGLDDKAEAPILDKDFEQLLLFVVKPYSKSKYPTKITPVNQDLLQSYASTYGYSIEKCSKTLNAKTNVRTLYDIQRFNDPLRSKFKREQKIIPDPSDETLTFPPPSQPFLMWQSKDGKRIANKLKSLSEDKVFWTLPYDAVTKDMLLAATKRAHFRKVDSRSKPEEANPGNPEPEVDSFLPSDRNTTSH